ncbi:MAG: MFS transporter [Alphaproteobacteria bacterium]|nr:MFS transporter [Alphaproteobacteria bacterium]
MAGPASATSRQGANRALAGIIGCIAVYALAYGLSTPLLSLLLEQRGVSRTLNGLNAAMPALAILLVSPFVPFLVRRIGARRYLLGALAIEAACFLLLKLFQDLAAWFVIRTVLGATAVSLWVVGEAWINQITPEARRGRVLGLYNTIAAGGFALGPAAIAVTGTAGWLPFLAAAGVLLAAGSPLLLARVGAADLGGGGPPGLVAFIAAMPVLFCGALLVGYVNGAALSLLPVYGVRSGLDEAAAAFMLVALGLGNVVLQLPVGWLADKLDRRRLLLALTLVGAAGAAALPYVVGHAWALWPVLFLWSGLFMSVYTIVLAMLGQRLRGAALMTGTAAMGVAWGAGGLLGPAAGGLAMDLWDPHGLAVAMAAGCLVFALFVVLRRA